MSESKMSIKNLKKVAKKAELIYVNDDIPGFTRKKYGQKWQYFDLNNNKIQQTKILNRIKKLAIPPAYTDIWISPIENSHLQATGKDAKGRKQYRYHPRWGAYRNESNQQRMVLFGEVLPKIREIVEHDLNNSDLDKNKVLATVVKLMDLTTIRVGNDEYAKENQTYGLTTLREKHVKIQGSKIRFEFKGKSHQKHTIEVQNLKLARIIQKCVDVPGYELFQYYSESGERHSVSSSDVNQYLKEISGEEFTAKDFRTWWGTVFAIIALRKCPNTNKKTEIKKNLIQTIKDVSKKLGNTPSVCKKYYIYSGVIDNYLAGEFADLIQKIDKSQSDINGLSDEEYCAYKFLKTNMSKHN